MLNTLSTGTYTTLGTSGPELVVSEPGGSLPLIYVATFDFASHDGASTIRLFAEDGSGSTEFDQSISAVPTPQIVIVGPAPYFAASIAIFIDETAGSGVFSINWVLYSVS